MQPLLARKLKLYMGFVLGGIVAGMIYQQLNEGFIGVASVYLGLTFGLAFGLLELFVFARLNLRLRKLPFSLALGVKATLYTCTIFAMSICMGFLAIFLGILAGEKAQIFYAYIGSAKHAELILYILLVYSIIILILQIRRLLGEGVLLRFVLGKYYRPVEEERIFMFLDLRSSTALAERAGHKRFYALLNALFHEITEPVLLTRAEIYQYVGDEVVLTWKTKDGTRDNNCLRAFFLIKERIQDNGEEYLSAYGVVPQFKAGLHFGKVVTGQIGDLKREIVYNGDVLNTTARIQELCNEYDRDLLISGGLLDQLELPGHLQQEHLGKVKLRGKEEEVHIYGIQERGTNRNGRQGGS